MTEPENLEREKATTEAAQVCPTCGEQMEVAETREDGSLTLTSHNHEEQGAPQDEASTAVRHDERGQEITAPEAADQQLPREQGTDVQVVRAEGGKA